MGDLAVLIGIVLVIIILIAAVVYSFIKKKTSYDTKGIPTIVEDKNEVEGSSKDEVEGTDDATIDNHD